MSIAQQVKAALLAIEHEPGDNITQTYRKRQVLQDLLKVISRVQAALFNSWHALTYTESSTCRPTSMHLRCSEPSLLSPHARRWQVRLPFCTSVGSQGCPAIRNCLADNKHHPGQPTPLSSTCRACPCCTCLAACQGSRCRRTS